MRSSPEAEEPRSPRPPRSSDDGGRARLLLALRIALAAVVIAAAVWFARRIDWRALLAAVRSADVAPLIAAAAVNLLHLGFRVGRLAVLLAPTRRVRFAPLYRYSLAMCAASNLLPARAGEVLRVWLLKAREGVPATTSVSISVVEKLFDVGALLAIASPLPWLLPSLPRWVSTSVAALGAISAAAVAALLVVSRLGAGAPGGWLDRVAKGAAVVRRPSLSALAIALSLAAWAADGAVALLVLRGLHVHIPIGGALLILLTLNLALAAPSLPAQFGAFEAGAVIALRLLGVPDERALAFALLYHALQAIPVTLLGLPDLRLAVSERRSGDARAG